MIPVARRERARFGRAVWPLLLVAGGLLGCGAERPDAAAGSAVTAAAKPVPTPPPAGECRRFTLCVPENPCHTGWVTGCRKNEPICTDIGGWLDNGTTCGAEAVCFMGQCVPCAAGERCAVRDQYGAEVACHAGVISCASGQPVCQDAGSAPDGQACWGGGGYVCKGGQCTWCVEGQWCLLPDQPCHVAAITGCATSGGTCTDTGAIQGTGSSCPYRDGNWGTGVCLDGTCNACDWGAPCTPPPAGECWEQAGYGSVQCGSGVPVCAPGWASPRPDGSVCAGGVCAGGACVPPCVPGEPCTDAAACLAGVTACSGPYSYCAFTGPAPDGTRCAEGAFCAAGACSACGAACAAADFCRAPGVLSCDTGLCEPGPAFEDGTSCGAGTETCAAGVCVGVEGAPIVTRGQTGLALDLTGTTWSRCSVENPGTSRRTTDTYALGTITHVEESFASNETCAGAADERVAVLATVVSAGYRSAGWAGPQPPGTPATPLATALHVTVDDPALGPTVLQFLIWVDDAVSPRALYQGEGKNGGTAPDGYPLRLYSEMTPLREVVLSCGSPCDPGFPTCAAYAVDCSGAVPACAATGATLADREPCGDGMTCTAGVCGAVPIRTVTGSADTTFWPDAGASLPSLTYLWWKSAIVFTGQTTTRQVDADSMGSPFSIAGVPQATYILALSGVPTTGRTLHLEMAGGTWNAGVDVLGRGDLTWGPGSPVTLAVDGLAPVTRSDVVGLVCSNAGFAMYPFGGAGTETLPFGAETAVTTVSWWGPNLDGALGDVTYLFQAATAWDPVNGTSVTAMARWGALPDTLAIGPEPATASVTLAPCPGTGTLSADWRISQFAAYAPQVHPDASVRAGRLAVFARPHLDPFAPGWRNGDVFGYSGGVPLLQIRAGSRTTDFPLSGLTYGRFLPPLWREYRLVRTQYDVPFTAPGATRSASLLAFAGWITPEDAAPATLEPAVSPPQSLRIGGQDAMLGAKHVGLMPVVSWAAPAVLPATGTPIYEVTVYEVRNSGGSTVLAHRYTGETARTSYRLPGINLDWNGRYVVTVTATVSERSIYAPLHQPVVRSFATAVTREFTP